MHPAAAAVPAEVRSCTARGGQEEPAQLRVPGERGSLLWGEEEWHRASSGPRAHWLVQASPYQGGEVVGSSGEEVLWRQGACVQEF